MNQKIESLFHHSSQLTNYNPANMTEQTRNDSEIIA
jgi:hypothetical protein